MNPSFFIAKSFVTKIELNVVNSAQFSPTPISHLETSLSVDVETSNSENNKCHLVEIHVDISSLTDDKEPVYNLHLDNSAIVGTPDDNIDESALSEILRIQVPKILLDNIRILVYQVTHDAGFPFMMRDDTFDHPIQNDESESPEQPNSGGACDFSDTISHDIPMMSESEFVDFQWLISLQWAKDDQDLLETVQGFLNVYTNQVGKEALIDYESLPIYKCYYRFFTPIEYHHPDFKECAESVWPMLFQMLFGSFQAHCNVVDDEVGLPEIEFTFQRFERRTISSLSLDELKDLLSDLLTEALTDTSVKLLDYQNASVMSLELPLIDQLIPEEDFYRLFNTCASDENASFLSAMYEKLDDCFSQTVFYQL